MLFRGGGGVQLVNRETLSTGADPSGGNSDADPEKIWIRPSRKTWIRNRPSNNKPDPDTAYVQPNKIRKENITFRREKNTNFDFSRSKQMPLTDHITKIAPLVCIKYNILSLDN